MTTIDPCKICGSPVRLVKRAEPRKMGQKQGQISEARVCTSAACASNTGNRKLGSTV